MKKIIDYFLPFSILGILLMIFLAVVLKLPDIENLAGTRNVEKPVYTGYATIRDGDFQRQFSKWFNQNFWGRSTAVVWCNQFVYSVFQDEVIGFIHGKDDWLITEEETLQNICGSYKDKIPWAEYSAYAMNLRRLQDYLEAHDKYFVYVISPTKAEVMFDKLTWRYKLLRYKYGDGKQGSHASLIAALDAAGVHYYDTTADMIALKQNGGAFDVFPKAGHHWTLTATALEINNIFNYIRGVYPQLNLPEISFAALTDKPYFTDNDLGDIFAIRYKLHSDKYTTPVIAYSEHTSLNVFLFGDSFSNQMASSLFFSQENSGFNRLIHQLYFTDKTIYNSSGIEKKTFAESDTPSALDIIGSIEGSNIVIMEQNTAKGLMPTHQKFIDYVDNEILLAKQKQEGE